MKKYLITLVLGCIIMQGLFAQSENQKIIEIDKTKLEIRNNISTLHKVVEVQDSAGYRYSYYNANGLTLISIYYKDKNIDKYVDWYFSNGQMIYTELTWTDNVTNKLIDNEKFYLSDGHMINWLKSGTKPVDITSKEFKQMDTLLVAYGGELETRYADKLKKSNK